MCDLKATSMWDPFIAIVRNLSSYLICMNILVLLMLIFWAHATCDGAKNIIPVVAVLLNGNSSAINWSLGTVSHRVVVAEVKLIVGIGVDVLINFLNFVQTLNWQQVNFKTYLVQMLSQWNGFVFDEKYNGDNTFFSHILYIDIVSFKFFAHLKYFL